MMWIGVDNGEAAILAGAQPSMSVIRKPQKADGKIVRVTALIRGSKIFTLHLNELHEWPDATGRPMATVDWLHLAVS
jgi:hypothetical protein